LRKCKFSKKGNSTAHNNKAEHPPGEEKMSDSLELSETIRLDFPASLKYLNILGACVSTILAHAQCAQDWPQDIEIATYNIQLALHEICTNIIIHAYGLVSVGRIEVSITLCPQKKHLQIELFDYGEPFDETKVAQPDLEHGQVHGYGIFLARSLMDTVLYKRLEQRNCWLLIKRL
jgi:serine/threonine-protein kinase RsbW